MVGLATNRRLVAQRHGIKNGPSNGDSKGQRIYGVEKILLAADRSAGADWVKCSKGAFQAGCALQDCNLPAIEVAASFQELAGIHRARAGVISSRGV
jgi:hypothetical protein